MSRTGLLALVVGAPALAVQLLAPVPRLDADAVEYYSHLRSLYFDHDVDFANEHSTTVRVSFLNSLVAPKTYKAALEAVGLRTDSPPDLETRSFHEWQSLDGYVVQIVAAPGADHIEIVVLSVGSTP